MDEIRIPRSVLDEMIAYKVFEMETKLQQDLAELIKPSNLKVKKLAEQVSLNQ